MSGSGRYSGRAAEESAKHLATGTRRANTGADGDRSAVPSSRAGRRQLARLLASLSDRDLAILRSVEGLHFATTGQLERLHFHPPATTLLAAARLARRSLARLHHLHLLDHLDRRVGGVRAGSASFVWLLTSLGFRLLGDDSRRRSREPSLAHLAHVLDVGELVVQLHERARTNAVDLLGVETEPGCWRPFVGHHGGRMLLKPDLRVTLGVGQVALHWFVELDRGTEHRPALTRKLAAYLAAWRDGGEQVRAGVFPRVLWVVPDERRAAVISSVWQAMPDVPEGMFATAVNASAVDVLAATGGAV